MTTTKPAPLTISITKAAADHVRAFTNAAGMAHSNLRVAVKGGGCSGLTYDLEMVEGPGDNDKTIVDNGIELYIDKKSYVFLAGTVLDYSGGLNGKGFVFNNPNAKTTCGCGTSFSV